VLEGIKVVRGPRRSKWGSSRLGLEARVTRVTGDGVRQSTAVVAFLAGIVVAEAERITPLPTRGFRMQFLGTF